ncbi:hypothetical protein [Ochrobactrum sp. Marseille-Q0166]|nr:hypothetical protein [Ochrobactrum sp. Marseille-Q0166]
MPQRLVVVLIAAIIGWTLLMVGLSLLVFQAIDLVRWKLATIAKI